VRGRKIAGALLIVVVLATLSSCSSGRRSLAPTKHPNIVFLLTDDLDVHEMAYMPHVRQLLTDKGVTFSHYYVSDSLCCPSRTTILRGQYAHNTGVESNGDLNGGFQTAYKLGIEKSTIGTWLRDAGYRTAYIGKYLNKYPATAKLTYVPPGWDLFASAVGGDPYSEYNYALNTDSYVSTYGDKTNDYGTTVYVDKAEQFIRRTAGKSFFLYLNVYAPHQPATPAPQDMNKFDNARAPRTPSFNAHVPGKPSWLSHLPHLGKGGIKDLDSLYRDRIRSLQAVDRGVVSLIATLRQTGQLANTYFVFSSDNGFHLGQFRMPAGKETAYESDIRVPLIVRGPGVPAHETSNFMTGNIDLAPTFAQLAGVTPASFVDGTSFANLLHDPHTDAHPRHAYLLEHWRATRSEAFGSEAGPNEPRDLDNEAGVSGKNTVAVPVTGPGSIPEYHGVRTEHYLYVEYPNGDRELYATDHDPYEMDNVVDEPMYAPLVARLHTLVHKLETCREATCRALEDAPVRGPRGSPATSKSDGLTNASSSSSSAAGGGLVTPIFDTNARA
jgi:N-acetylglucosamine-6-sulfatase